METYQSNFDGIFVNDELESPSVEEALPAVTNRGLDKYDAICTNYTIHNISNKLQ